MRTIDIARRMAELDQKEDAQKAYLLALQEAEGKNPEEEMEAASYIFFSEGDYEVAYTTFVSLYNRGCFQAELMDLLTQAFYLPNVKSQQKQYERNCTLLSRYPYFFQKEFPGFEDLPIQFFPFNDQGYIPFEKTKNHFDNYVNFNHPVIDRNFFKDLENPILASDVYSQYQLEYLNDNVRKSEWVGRENHIYLHYTDWLTFCAYLQCLDFQELLKDKKLVFLFGEERSLYPIDFKERFGIDYSQYPVKRIGIREIKRLIWHTQLAAHNGGDFFNEIFDGHPNLLAVPSVMFEDVLSQIKKIKKNLKRAESLKAEKSPLLRELSQLKNLTDKDYFVAMYLSEKVVQKSLDLNSRIVPAIFFQPHFSNMVFQLKTDEKTGASLLFSEQYEAIRKSPLFSQFKYIKTFTPMRRITGSYGATIRFMHRQAKENADGVISDVFAERLLNQSYLIDWQDRLFQDSILVRFEDGKLNPKATFTALAAFLDLPYTESMTYCSGFTGINPESMKGNDLGFDPAAIYRTYDEYTDDADRCLLEYFLRDAYQAYGYDFHYYHGEEATQEWLDEKLQNIKTLNRLICESISSSLVMGKNLRDDEEKAQKVREGISEYRMESFDRNRKKITSIMLKTLHFYNKNGQPLHMMKLLQLDPALLEQPLYH